MYPSTTTSLLSNIPDLLTHFYPATNLDGRICTVEMAVSNKPAQVTFDINDIHPDIPGKIIISFKGFVIRCNDQTVRSRYNFIHSFSSPEIMT